MNVSHVHVYARKTQHMRFYFLLLFQLVFVVSARSQQPEWRFEATLDSLLKKYDPGPEKPGFVVCILEKGAIVYERQFGLANLEQKKPMRAETVFNLGSITKQFIATGILLLEEQGKLKRSDPIQKYLPELPDFGQPITLDHLISHTSGLYSFIEVSNLHRKYKNKYLQPKALFAFYQGFPQSAFPVGTDFFYNNSAYAMLKIVLERVSGMPAGDFLQQQIFQPLGMKNARFCLDESEGIPDGCTSYSFNESKKKYKHPKPIQNLAGATGVFCNLHDLAQWQFNFEHNHLGKGGPELIRQMETTHYLNNGASVHYGAGLFLKTYRGIPVVEHGGGWNEFLVQSRRFPESGISVLVASNNPVSNPFRIADAICDKFFVFPDTMRAFDPGKLPLPSAQFEGIFLSANNRLRLVRMDADTLKIYNKQLGSKKYVSLRYEPTKSSDTLFTFSEIRSGELVQFVAGEDKHIKGFYWAGGDYFVCRRFYERQVQRRLTYAQKTGVYRIQGQKMKIRIKQGLFKRQLKISPAPFVSFRLEPLSDALYRVVGDESLLVRFDGTHMILGGYEVPNLIFTKK